MGKNQYVYLVTNDEDADVLQKINQFGKTLPEINLKMQTGIIVDFRSKEVLRDKLEEGSYPLLYSQHIQGGRVIWPQGKEGEVIIYSVGGMPIEDIAWGTMVYRNALKKGIGQTLNLWDVPQMI